jgi:GntR family transcriptional regulator/MocR family aminotransferase
MATGPELLLDLEGGRGRIPLRKRVEEALRAAIRAGRLRAGDRLPSTRALAAELGCSRWVVVEAYGQLAAEGWLEGRSGSGTRVRARETAPALAHESPPPSALPRARYDFTLGLPDLVAFPRGAWLRALQNAVRTAPAAELGHVDSAGLGTLRAELAAYLGRVRGTSASARHVVVTAGFTHGLGLLARALRAAGHERLGLEDPGFPLLHGFVTQSGLTPVPVGVDAGGISVEALIASGARAVVVTPAHQFPLGHVMTADRRAELLAWRPRWTG